MDEFGHGLGHGLARCAGWHGTGCCPEGEAWVPAWVTRCGDTIAVVHRDGAVEEVPRAEVRSIELAPGQRLTAFFRGGARSFPGRVLERASGRIHVGYDDGDQEWIRRRRSSARPVSRRKMASGR